MRMAANFFSFAASSCHLFFFFSLVLHHVNSMASHSQHKTHTSHITLGGETTPPRPPASTTNSECGCTLPPPPPPVDPVIRRSIRVIQKFKKAITNDPNGVTKTWRGNELCVNSEAYKGFYCYMPKGSAQHRVGGIYFNGFNLDGEQLSLNSFVESFQDLAVIHVNSNNFTAGQVPLGVSASKLPTLFELDLSNNKLGGGFPATVLEATNLTFLDLRFNMLTGPIPPRVFTLDLDALFLNNNGFTGWIPQNLGSTPAFFLTLANNKLTGPIPKSIGGASKTLTEVLFLNNKLSGCLPYEIGLLKNASVFDASVNLLTGPLPQSLGCLSQLEILNLTSNQLYGTVPESLCKLKDLEELSLSGNYFTQIGPDCRKLLETKVLEIDNNCVLDLPNQRSAEECKKFFLQPRKCPDPKSMLYVPCDISELPKMEDTYHRPQKLKRRTSRTYKALNTHRQH